MLFRLQIGSSTRTIFEKYWYQLEVVKRDTRELVQTTRQYTYASEPTVIGREVRRRNNLLLREHTGVPILYYPIRTEGMRCPECWGESEGQRVRSKCSNCFDTGWLLGYYNPLLMYMNIHADQQQLSENAETDRFAVRTGTGFIAGDIPIQFGDLVLEETNSRWAVSSYDKTEMLRSTVSFRIRLHQVIESDIRYRVPLPEAEIFERFVKSREYSRPYTLNPGGVQGVPR